MNDGEGSYNKGVTLNLKWFTVRFAFWQEYMEWIKYGKYHWHNFQFLKIAIEDNYPFHGRFDLHIELALLGLNLLIEVESTKDNSERFAESERWWNENVIDHADEEFRTEYPGVFEHDKDISSQPPPWPEELA